VAFCGAAEDGMGFFQIQAVRSNQIVNSAQVSFAALITMETGEVNAQLIRSELARIIPVRLDWEVQDLGNKSFVVPFPSKEELERMVAIHMITTRNKEGTLTFEEFVDDVQPIKVLEQVWVTSPKCLVPFVHFFLCGQSGPSLGPLRRLICYTSGRLAKSELW
jgi:hypothetical protein